MPELPEVETVRKQLLRNLQYKTIKSINIIHNNVFENQDINEVKINIRNQTINDIKRRGKWLIFELDNYDLLSHLRMEGKYFYRKPNDKVEIFTPDGNIYPYTITKIYDEDLNELDVARHPEQVLKIPFEKELPPYSMIRLIEEG